MLANIPAMLLTTAIVVRVFDTGAPVFLIAVAWLIATVPPAAHTLPEVR